MDNSHQSSHDSSSIVTYANYPTNPHDEQKTGGGLVRRPQYPFQRSIHSVRKTPSKPWKKPTAPLPPTPTRVYKVDPINFRKVVQKLTGFTPSETTRHRHVAPPPLSVDARWTPGGGNQQKMSAGGYKDSMFGEAVETTNARNNNWMDGLGLCLSPSSYSWCSIPILSPKTLSSL